MPTTFVVHEGNKVIALPTKLTGIIYTISRPKTLVFFLALEDSYVNRAVKYSGLEYCSGVKISQRWVDSGIYTRSKEGRKILFQMTAKGKKIKSLVIKYIEVLINGKA